jgi:hypothetical protein
MQGSLAKQCRHLARQANTAVQSPSDSQRAGLKALYAAFTVVALEPLKLPTAALPKALLSPAEFCILKLLGYISFMPEQNSKLKIYDLFDNRE